MKNCLICFSIFSSVAHIYDCVITWGIIWMENSWLKFKTIRLADNIEFFLEPRQQKLLKNFLSDVITYNLFKYSIFFLFDFDL